MSKGFFIATMGCQMNKYDSDHLARELMKKGYVPVETADQADVVLINTCTVREKADQKAMSLLGRISRIKRKRPHMVLGMAGCLAQREGSGLMQRFSQLDMVVGPRELSNIGKLLDRVISQKEKVTATCLDLPPITATQPHHLQKKEITAYVSIMQGCNNFCTYCIVPYVRGREISRLPQDIVNEVRVLISRGTKEITLLGQNVNSYHSDAGAPYDFVSLLHEINALKGLLRIRFTTSHPKDLSDQLIRCFKELDHLCPHIHLPFQSGSNDVLRRMKRGYAREQYLKLVDKLRETVPGMAITSDVMVGFPGESLKDFEDTLDLIDKIQFDSLFSFKYSDREDTVAAHMNNKVHEQEKTRRLNNLQALQRNITLQKNKALEGKVLPVLVEGHSKKGNRLMGRSETNRIVNFCHNGMEFGDIVNVLIEHSSANSLQGEATHS